MFCSDKEFRAICAYNLVHKSFTSQEIPSPVIDAVSMHTDAVPKYLSQPPHCQAQNNLSAMSWSDWAKLKREDPVIG